MNDKQFSITIINEKNNLHKSLSISFLKFKIVVFFVLTTTVLSIITIIDWYNKETIQNQLDMIYKKENKVLSLINAMKENGVVNDSVLQKFNILEDYEQINRFLPISKPVEGIITRGINSTISHNGVDIAAVYKSDVRAVQKGIVVLADKINELGNTVIISHHENFFSLYAHLDKINVNKRQVVEKKQNIGTIGKANNNEGPHLHFEIWHNNVIIDPRNLIEEYKEKDVSIE
tara:strand:- start:2 stop:697 length:696 start_codon:yes stop_codon:yes gene_type:complete